MTFGSRISTGDERFLRQGVLPRFGDYELESEIARGGMGIVYRARQKSLNRTVAVKVLLAGQLATPESVQRFRLEAEAAAQLHHPGIVPIYEIGEHDTQYFFSMELIDGVSLAECLEDFRLQPRASAAERRRQEQCIAELLVKISEALDFAHRRGVLHRDLKPSNILIDESGVPRLTDFGLAKLTGRESSGLTLSTAVLGTPGYLAPEQAAGKVDEVTTAADVYGLGATLYELLTGRPPFSGTTAVATMLMAIDQPPASPRSINPEINRDLETIAMRCLEKQPERRYPSAAAVAEELQRFLRHEPILARPVGRLQTTWRWCQRNPWLASLTATLLITVIGATAVVGWQWRRAEQANAKLTDTVADLEWDAIDDQLRRGESGRALARLAKMIRDNPADKAAATLAISILEHRPFPVAAAPPIRHPTGSELSIARLSPDGKRVVTASFDGTARIWDSNTSRELTPPLAHRRTVTWAEFSPDSRLVVTTCADGTVRLWDSQTGLPASDAIAQSESVSQASFSSDGRLLVTRGKSAVCVVDVPARKVLHTLVSSADAIINARFIQTGSRLLVTSRKGRQATVQTFDALTGQVLATMQCPDCRSTDVTGDEKHVVVVEQDGTAWVADFPSGENRVPLANANGPLQFAVFDRDGRNVSVTGLNHFVRVWDSRSGLPITGELSHDYLLTGSIFLPDGKLMSWAQDATAKLWDVAAGGEAASEPMFHNYRVVHAEHGMINGREVFLTTASHLKSRSEQTQTGVARLWRVHEGRNPKDRIVGRDRAFDASRMYGNGLWAILCWERKPIRTIDLQTSKEVGRQFTVDGQAWGLHFNRAGNLIVTTSTGEVSVWKVPEGERIAGPVKFKTTIQPSEISPDLRCFATGSTDGFVRIWNADTCMVIHQMKHGSEINSVCFSPDSRLLASAGEDRIVRIWDVASGTQVLQLVGHQNEVNSVFFSPDGAKIATASLDFTARLWDARTGQSIAVMPHSGEVLDVAFSANSKHLATASRDGTSVIWDASTGAQQTRTLRLTTSVRNVRFTPDSSVLVTLDFRGLRLWDVKTGHPLSVHMRHIVGGGTGFQTSSGRFEFLPDASAILLGYDCEFARLWGLTRPTEQAPAWFADLLEAVGGQRIVHGTEQPELLPPERFLEVQKAIQLSTDSGFHALWAKQWLRSGQPIANP